MAETRFSISKKFGASEVTFFEGPAAVTVPVSGIPGLAGYGFAALLDAQLVGGPKTLEYVSNVAADLSIYLSSIWKPGHSAGVMRRQFQLTRALVSVTANGKGRKPVSFAEMLKRVAELTDSEREALWMRPQVSAIVAGWNAKSERKPPVDVSAKFKSLVG